MKKLKLTKTIFLYLNEKEFSMLTKDAERANMSMSRYIRHQIDNAKMKPTFVSLGNHERKFKGELLPLIHNLLSSVVYEPTEVMRLPVPPNSLSVMLVSPSSQSLFFLELNSTVGALHHMSKCPL